MRSLQSHTLQSHTARYEKYTSLYFEFFHSLYSSRIHQRSTVETYQCKSPIAKQELDRPDKERPTTDIRGTNVTVGEGKN